VRLTTGSRTKNRQHAVMDVDGTMLVMWCGKRFSRFEVETAPMKAECCRGCLRAIMEAS
jgi:hypothetical protein